MGGQPFVVNIWFQWLSIQFIWTGISTNKFTQNMFENTFQETDIVSTENQQVKVPDKL